MRRGSQTVRQRSAKSRKSVRLRSTPPFFCLFSGFQAKNSIWNKKERKKLDFFRINSYILKRVVARVVEWQTQKT